MSEGQASADRARPPVLDRIEEIGVLLVILAAPTQYSFELAGKVHLCVVDPLIWALGAFMIGRRILSRELRSLAMPPLFAVLFVALAMASVWVAGNRMDAAKDVFQYIEYLLLGTVVFGTAARDPARMRRMVTALLAVTAAILVVALLQYSDGDRETLAVGGTFGNRNVLGGYLCLALPFAFALLLHGPCLARRIAGATMLVAGTGVLLSGAAALGLALALLVLATARDARLGVAALAVLLGLTMLLPLLPRDNGETLISSVLLYPDGYDLSRRYPEWQSAFVMIQEQPWLGVGVGNYQQNIGMYFGSLPDPTGPNEPDTQNLYLVLGSSLGLPALLCFIGLLLVPLRGGVLRYGHGGDVQDRAVALGVIGAVLAFAICCLWAPLLVRGVGLPLALVIALGTQAGRGQRA